MCPRVARFRAAGPPGHHRAQPAAGTEDGAGAPSRVTAAGRDRERDCIATCGPFGQVAGARRDRGPP